MKHPASRLFVEISTVTDPNRIILKMSQSQSYNFISQLCYFFVLWKPSYRAYFFEFWACFCGKMGNGMADGSGASKPDQKVDPLVGTFWWSVNCYLEDMFSGSFIHNTSTTDKD